jgi:hypothetical protein
LPPASFTSAANAFSRARVNSLAYTSEPSSNGAPPSGACFPSDGGNRTNTAAQGIGHAWTTARAPALGFLPTRTILLTAAAIIASAVIAPPALGQTPSAPPSTQSPSTPSTTTPDASPLAVADYVPCTSSTFPGDPWAICKHYGLLNQITLRWGDANFGYRHIRDKRGFGPTTDDRIYDTTTSGTIEVQGTARVYRKDSYGCPYKVVYETASTQGIITAYCVG